MNIIPRDHHPVSRKKISPNAVKVLYRLNNAGFDAFLVGGGVRDIYLNDTPKDFDIATNATPEEVRSLFGNCRLIGRRFRLAHVRFGREIIEVATFRAGHDKVEESSVQAATNQEGQILRDNVYGNQQEDALRRDFTVNALYYSVADFSVYDYVGGVQDLEDRLLRLIGDPATRYREDPVRMLRAARFSAKLDFAIESATAAPIEELAPLLLNIPSARLFEEVLKLFLSGQGFRTFSILRELGLFKFLFPGADDLLEAGAPYAEKLLTAALKNTDSRINANKPVTPAFLYATMLWPEVLQNKTVYTEQGLPPLPATHKAAQIVIEQQIKHTALPRRFSQPMKEIWELQERLVKRQGRRAEALLEHPRFRAAYDFLLLREQSGEQLEGLGDWWTEFQQSDPNHRLKLQEKTSGKSGKPRRPRRPRHRPRKRD